MKLPSHWLLIEQRSIESLPGTQALFEALEGTRGQNGQTPPPCGADVLPIESDNKPRAWDTSKS